MSDDLHLLLSQLRNRLELIVGLAGSALVGYRKGVLTMTNIVAEDLKLILENGEEAQRALEEFEGP